MTAGPELPPYRPPSEAGSVLVRVTRGCAWNRCTFCGMYKEQRFSVRKLDEIRADLALLRAETPHARSVFLADSDALVHPRLPDVVAAVRATFPEAERITSYARLHTLVHRPFARLEAARAAGLTRIHAGLESGAPAVLAAVHKGATPELAREAGRRAIEAGFTLSLYLLSGLGGETDWEAHARDSGRLLGEIAPHFIRLRTLVLLAGTPLHAAWKEGRFSPATPETRLRETELLLRTLLATVPQREIELTSDHFSNYVYADGELVYGGINGYLPEEGETLLATLSAARAAVASARQVYDPASLARRGHLTGLYAPRL